MIEYFLFEAHKCPEEYDTAPWCSGSTCRPVTAKIVGSNPIGVAIFAQVAQSVEQGTENPRVGGSIPSLSTNCFAEVAQW